MLIAFHSPIGFRELREGGTMSQIAPVSNSGFMPLKFFVYQASSKQVRKNNFTLDAQNGLFSGVFSTPYVKKLMRACLGVGSPCRRPQPGSPSWHCGEPP